MRRPQPIATDREGNHRSRFRFRSRPCGADFLNGFASLSKSGIEGEILAESQTKFRAGLHGILKSFEFLGEIDSLQ